MVIKEYMTGPIGVNTYLVYDESKKGFIVDPGGYSERLVKAVEADGVTIEYIMLTHGHADHFGGIEQFKAQYPDAKVIACAQERETLHSPVINSSPEIMGRSVIFDADIYVNDGDRLTVGNTEWTFLHTPGHTEGGMCILSGDKLFSGDTLFKASIGRTDFPGGDFGKIVDSIRTKLYTLPDNTMVYPGHMGSTTIEYEKRHNPFV